MYGHHAILATYFSHEIKHQKCDYNIKPQKCCPVTVAIFHKKLTNCQMDLMWPDQNRRSILTKILEPICTEILQVWHDNKKILRAL